MEIRDLHISFHRLGQTLQAVRGVDLIVREGETLGIVGESGSGKSTLVRSLAKLLPSSSATIDRGEIWFKGKNILKYSSSQLQKIRGKEIGMIFQDPMTCLTPTMKIGKQIAEAYLCHYPKMDPRPVVLSLLQRVGISDPERRLDEYPHTMSGGMRQRVMIAIALAANPALLIADEPTTALDVTVQAQILTLMQEIQKEKTTILITHDLSLAAGFCDRILVMYAGEIVEDATTDELLKILSTPTPSASSRRLQGWTFPIAPPSRRSRDSRPTSPLRLQGAVFIPDAIKGCRSAVARRRLPLISQGINPSAGSMIRGGKNESSRDCP